jgi:hypothetical protein
MTSAIALTLALLVAELPLVVGKAAAGSSQVELRNTGTQSINAWAFAISSPNASGGIHRVFRSSDVYMSEVTGNLQGAEPHLRSLKAGESRAVPVDPLPANASVEVIAVVLEDNTAMGDDQTIATFFQKRRAERDELKRVVDTFNAVLPAQGGAAALEELKRRFDAGATSEESVAHRSARQAVESWLQRARSGGGDEETNRSLSTYVAFVTKQYEVAAKHAERKA